MRAEADAIVFEATEDHGRLAALRRRGARLPRRASRCASSPTATRDRSRAASSGRRWASSRPPTTTSAPIHVWVDETRPYLQGARLTAWELAQAGVPHTLIPDVAAGHLMARAKSTTVIVGADRIAANGDTANKVGTYTLAVLAARHGIPFYVAAPISSVDLADPRPAPPSRSRSGRRTRSCRSAACASRRPTRTSATRRST